MEGHFARFEERLKKQNHSRKFNYRTLWRVAAAVVFVLLAVNQTVIYLSPKEKKVVTLSDVSNEYREVEFYYTSSINTGLEQWKYLDNAGYLTEDDKKMMENELKEFDKVQADLQSDLKANPEDERVINAMLDYYQNKLNVITLIIEKLKEVQNQKESSHETKV
jgi:hypothetical protein